MKKNIISAALMLAGISPVATAQDTAKKEISFSFIEGAFAHDNFNSNGLGINDRDGVGNTADDNFGILGEATGNGGGARLSVELPFGSNAMGFHAVADYLQTGHDVGIAITDEFGAPTASGVVALDQSEFRAAFGVHSKASKYFSLFGELGFTTNKVDLGTANLVAGPNAISADLGPASGSRTALDARIGGRGILGKRTELLGYVRYSGNGKLETATDGTVGFTGKVIAGAGAYYHFSDRFQLGADYEFGTPGRFRAVARFTF
ncbi:MAG: hypothetical protein JJ850_03840 [Kordiimonadaceae bacterium]|nr:hypothetical protein [Kordiimonadaceae bacterium]MBO6568551.1 hypothetical protein [Kordiimonadaceae bacterium]MBO6963720.1 hypothetical protein [Kordiimonadaceae bacterium]